MEDLATKRFEAFEFLLHALITININNITLRRTADQLVYNRIKDTWKKRRRKEAAAKLTLLLSIRDH